MPVIDQLFQQLRAENRKAFIPFVTAGDPNLEFTRVLIERLAQHGCSLCEIGVPYSDPIADGPVIQASYMRALSHHVHLVDILQMVQLIAAHVTMPLISMVSYAIVYRHGLERYVIDAKAAGLAGLIVPDLLIEESEPLADICWRHELSLIQLVTPTTSRDRALRIAQQSTGFLYYVSVTGITGERQELPAEVVEQVGWLRQQTSLPICIGFGISKPQHVRMLAPVADGFIVGSALVRFLSRLDTEAPETVLGDILRLVDELLEE